ncbi:MAG: hypothetical protein ACFB8W_23120 [Elainellaceae cyanobacterium]
MPWQPQNKYVWDFWFARQGQTLHLFYLQASKLACAYNPKKRHNLASIGHAVLTEYGWRELTPDQPAFASRSGEHWDNLSIWTGSILKEGGLYYFFYTARCREAPWITTIFERRRSQNIGVAVSEDLVNWRRTATSAEKPVIPNPGETNDFDGINWHDPSVIKDDTDGKFYAFICAHPQQSLPDAGGMVAYATSADLEHWQDEPYRILYRSDEFFLLEVPQVFWRRMNDQSWRLYLLFSPRWSPFFNQPISMGITYYVRSRPIADRSQVSYDRIPWEPEPARVLAAAAGAGKLLEPTLMVHPLFLGFQYGDEGDHFVGMVTDPQWATFAEDGTLQLSHSDPLAKP